MSYSVAPTNQQFSQEERCFDAGDFHREQNIDRVWSETKKVLISQVMSKKCIEIPYAGKFMLFNETTISFMPTLELLTNGHFQLV